MKKIYLILVTTIAILSLTACTSDTTSKDNNKENDTIKEATVEEPTKENTTESEEITEEQELNSEEDTEKITFYHGDDNAENLVAEELVIAELSPQSLFDILYEKDVLSSEVTVNSFEVKGTQIILDVSKEFAANLQGMGTAGEYIILGSVVNTFLDNYSAESLSITVDGKTLETGHNIYDYELTYYK